MLLGNSYWGNEEMLPANYCWEIQSGEIYFVEMMKTCLVKWKMLSGNYCWEIRNGTLVFVEMLKSC
jgi:hypothetical protein